MKIKVNSDIIKSLLPCEDRLVNYLKHYNELNFDILEFLALDKITTEDKVWVALKLMPKELVAAFALECSSRASAYAAKAYTALSVSDKASYAAKGALSAAYDAPLTASYYAAVAASYAASYAADAAYLAASYATNADRAYAEERELQLKSIAQLIEESK